MQRIIEKQAAEIDERGKIIDNLARKVEFLMGVLETWNEPTR